VTVVEARLEDWPWSIVPGVEYAVKAPNREMTKTPAELEVTCAPALSVTWSSKDHVPVAVEEVVAKV
jgi:hypothetical protein